MSASNRCLPSPPTTILRCLLAVGVVTVACEESVNAPGVCPDFCPPSVIEVVDTVLFNAVERDSAFTGYVNAFRAPRMQVTGADAALESRGVIRFLRLPQDVLVDGATTGAIVTVDSFRVDVNLRTRSRSATGLEVLLYRIPATVDSTVTFADLGPFFNDSTLVGSVAVHDTIVQDSLAIILPSDAFPTLEADEFVAAVGISVRADVPAFATLGTTESLLGALLTRFTQVDSLGADTVPRSNARGVGLDTFVHDVLPHPGGDILMVGGTPSSRSLLRLNVPRFITDSAQVVGATLVLIPIVEVAGAPADTFRVDASALSADFGPKSPLVPRVVSDLDSASLFPGTAIAVGSTDTVAIDITELVRGWQADSSRPRSLMVRLPSGTEGASLGTLFFGSSRTPGAAPFLRITYVPPFDFEGR